MSYSPQSRRLTISANNTEVISYDLENLVVAPAEVAIGEMLRVLKSGGRIAFSTWPPELIIGRMFALTAGYLPPAPGPKPAPSWEWGDPNIVVRRLGDAVRDVTRHYGVFFAKKEDGSVEHSQLTTLVDADGEMRVQYLGARFDPEEFRRDLISLIDKE